MAETKKVKLPSGRHASQIKRQRQNLKQAARNRLIRSEVRTFIKKLLQSVEAKNKEQAQSDFVQTTKILQKSVSKGIYHKNTASRSISRLSKKVKALG